MSNSRQMTDEEIKEFGRNLLAHTDLDIAECEKRLRELQEERREIINRYDLNKPVEYPGKWDDEFYQEAE